MPVNEESAAPLVQVRLVEHADTLMPWEVVTVEQLSPNVTPLLFEKVIAPRLFEVVPALKLTSAAAEAVIVDPFRPKLTPFEFENVIALRLLLVVPADT